MIPHVTSAEMHSIRRLLKEGDGKHLFWQTLIAATTRCQFSLLVGSDVMDRMDGSCLNKERSKIKMRQSELSPMCLISVCFASASCDFKTFIFNQKPFKMLGSILSFPSMISHFVISLFNSVCVNKVLHL